MGMGKGGILGEGGNLGGSGEGGWGCLSMGISFSPLHVWFAWEMYLSPKGNQPLPPLKAKGSPSNTIGGRRGGKGGCGNCTGARGAPLESICVIKPFEGRGRRGYKLFLSHVLSLHSVCWSNQLFVLLPWVPASRRNSLPQSQNISWRYCYTVKVCLACWNNPYLF